MAENTPPRDDDPQPQPQPPPPPAPDPGDCCGDGCANCVHDLHEQAMVRYREQMAAWLARHSEATPAIRTDSVR